MKADITSALQAAFASSTQSLSNTSCRSLAPLLLVMSLPLPSRESAAADDWKEQQGGNAEFNAESKSDMNFKSEFTCSNINRLSVTTKMVGHLYIL